MKTQINKSKGSKYIKDEVTLAYLKENSDVLKIKENDGSFDVDYKDGTKSIFIKLVNGKCSHPFAIMGQGYDGKYYYACDTGGSCEYKRELSEQEVEKFIREPEREADK